MKALIILAQASMADGAPKMEGLGDAVTLMVIGMATVFTVLLLVIMTAKFLINIVNKYIPEEAKPEQRSAGSASAIDPQTTQAIEMAIAKLTNGKGKVESISKL